MDSVCNGKWSLAEPKWTEKDCVVKGNLSRILYLKLLKIVFFSTSFNDEAEGNRCNAEKEAKKVSQVFLIIQGGGKIR
jgi:hypothetical protein